MFGLNNNKQNFIDILRECTLVKCHCGIFIDLPSSTIGQRGKRVLGHGAKLGQCAKFGERAKSRQRSGHKAIKETEKPFKTEFNQSKAETNDNCGKLSARDLHHTRVNSASAMPSEPTLSPPASKKQSKQYLQCFHQNLRHLTF